MKLWQKFKAWRLRKIWGNVTREEFETAKRLLDGKAFGE